MVLLAHHTIADGFGVVASALTFFEPRITLSRDADLAAAGSLRRALATVIGIAQRATNGTPNAPLSLMTSPTRQFGATTADLDVVRMVARRHRCRVTDDVLLCAVAGALSRRRPDLAGRIGSQLRVAVPLLVAEPRAVTGNVTAGVIVDLPLEPMPEAERLELIAARSRRLRTPTRALASRMVVARGLALAPASVARWLARTVYGHRFFQAIVSNMTGPTEQLRLAGARLTDVVPNLPWHPERRWPLVRSDGPGDSVWA